MSPHSSLFARSLVCAFLLMAVAPARAAEPRTLLVRGRVTGPDGWAVSGVTVAAGGTRAARAVTDAHGNYALYLPLPSLDELARTPLALRLAPVRAGWTFVRAGGKGAAGLEIEIVGPPARARVRAPDAAFANAVAGALTARSVSVVFADLDFTGAQVSMEVGDAPVEMLAEVVVPVTGVKVVARPDAARSPAPRPTPPASHVAADSAHVRTRTAAPTERAAQQLAARVAKARAESLRVADTRARRAREDSLRVAQARARTAREDSLRALAAEARTTRADSLPSAGARGPKVSDRPPATARPAPEVAPSRAPVAAPRATAPPVAAPPVASDTCACVVKGTLEARSERRIPEYLKITLWIDDHPASRDSVELFMGVPRPFEMLAPCGPHRLAMHVEPRLQRYVAGPPAAFAGFTCVPSRPSQWRLVLQVK